MTIDWKTHNQLQKALSSYLTSNNLELTGNETYSAGIDCVFVMLDNNPLLIISLPPTSDYVVDETEYTASYLRKFVRSTPGSLPQPV